jgi:hypothetical protein
MAASKEKTLDELISELNTIDLSNTTVQADINWGTDTITLSSPTSSMLDSGYGAIPSISITGGVSGAQLTHTGQNAIWTTSGTGYTIGTTTNTNPYTIMGAGTTVSQGGTISLKGEKADIDINGKSLTTWMEKVEERLNIMTPNPELEKEWDDLRKLGERYRKLEKKCKEKAEVWKKLKTMPKPNIDL